MHVLRQRFHGYGQPGFHVLNHLIRICTVAHNHNAAHRFALPIRLGNAAAHVRTILNRRHVPQQNGHAAIPHPDGDFFKVVEVGDITLHAQNEFAFRQFQRTSANFAITAFHGRADIFQGQVVGAQLRRVHRHLILFHEPAHGRDLRHAGHGCELIFQIPVLERPQFRQVTIRGVQRIHERPPHPGGVRSQ